MTKGEFTKYQSKQRHNVCNAWNHPADCTCGWGGENHLGGGWGVSNSYEPFSSQDGALISYRYGEGDFCRPTNCPECGESVFFIRHNDGSVWVDPPLGWPWPKHRHCNDAGSLLYLFTESLGAELPVDHESSNLGLVRKRIYRNHDHIYLIELCDGRVVALSASRYETIIFEHHVAVRHSESMIFLEDERRSRVRVRNFKLTEESLDEYLQNPKKVIREQSKQRQKSEAEHKQHEVEQSVSSASPDPSPDVVWSILKQKFVPKNSK